jgi:hypothetical protein
MGRHSRIKKLNATALGTIVAAMVMVITSPVGATSIFEANLTGSQETPPNASPASGFGTFVLNEAMTQLSFNVTYAGLIGGDLVGAHFHEGPVGVAAPIVRGVSLDGATIPSGVFTGVWTNVDAEPLTSTRVNALFAGLAAKFEASSS